MLIQVRIGPGKSKLIESIIRISRLCSIPAGKIHRVPHITLYGSFSADYEQVKRVKEVIASIGKKYSYLPYLIDGFRWINSRQGRVIYFNIVASPQLKRFRQELADRLLRIVPETKPFDREDNFLFHSTLAYKLDSIEFERAWSYVSSNKALSEKFSSSTTDSEDYHMRYFYLPLHALRVTFINDQSRVVCEYDFLQQKLLSRGESQDADSWSRTLKLFRIDKGIEGGKPGNKQKSPYVISDLHLDYSNIIQYCARPFVSSNVDEMNSVLIENWNNTVGNNEIYFLGDLSTGKDARPDNYWADKLQGKIHFIKGSQHDTPSESEEYVVFRHGRYKFLLIHDPDRRPSNWHHWTIHGHKHNNDMKHYPFINGDRKTINVCPELLNYRPVSFDFLTSLNLDSIKRMDTIDSVPVTR
jgi:calcineurin-like phosphoesterase family protein/2'-5' RNA ligase